MAFSLKFKDILPAVVRDEFDSLVSQLQGYVSQEHKDDGGHGDIVPDSITLQGGLVGTPVSLPWTTARFVAAFTAGTWSITTTESEMAYLRVARVGQIAFVSFSIRDTTIATDSVEELWIRLPELHAIPAINASGVAVDFAGGICKWVSSAGGGTVGTGLVSPAADNFSSAVPGTLLVVTQYIYDGAGSTGLKQWPIGDIDINGSCWFFLEPNNQPTPFFGA